MGMKIIFCKVWKFVKVIIMWMIVWCVNISYFWVNFMVEISVLYGDLVKLFIFLYDDFWYIM